MICEMLVLRNRLAIDRTGLEHTIALSLSDTIFSQPIEHQYMCKYQTLLDARYALGIRFA